MMFFKDERGERISNFQLYQEYMKLKKNGETTQPAYWNYIKECCCKNGTLEKINKTSTRREMLQTLSEAINFSDDNDGGDLGDRLFEVLVTIRNEWGLENE